jgi:hypothetical protein
VHLSRTIESVAIPVFQFGTFSDVDLSFFAGPNFNFGGRVHTNGNLFLSEGNGATLTLSGKVTAVKEVVRQRLQNGVSIDTAPAHAGIVSMATSASAFRSLLRTEGSVFDFPVTNPANPDPSWNEPTWYGVSLSAYNSWIRNGRTGAKTLNLPLITVGGTNPDLIRRPPVNENVANPVLFNERLFTKASIRILLSDLAADITNLPTVTAIPAPVQLDGDWKLAPPAGYVVDATHPPIARSMGPVAAMVASATAAGAATIDIPGNVPALFQNPANLFVRDAGGVYRSAITGCTGRTDTQWTGCTIAGQALVVGWKVYVGAAAGSNVAVAGNMPGTIPIATVAAAQAVGGGKTVTVGAGETWQFFTNTFWMTDVNGAGAADNTATLVTCVDYAPATPRLLKGCTGVPATVAGATLTSGYASTQNTGTIGGFLKIERQTPAGVWVDVTTEILNYGIGGPSQTNGGLCGDPTPNAILRIQRLRDSGGAPATCPSDTTAGGFTTNSYDYWPNTLFDTREGLQRDVALPTGEVPLGGVMQFLTIDVANLSRWFTATAPFAGGTGANSARNNGGFTVYFSDRRNNRKADNTESAEYGWEDFVNPASATGAPNNVLDTGEDVNASATLDVYGQFPNPMNGTSNNVPAWGLAPLNGAARPITPITTAVAQVNRSILFRRALKLTQGNNIRGLGVTGLTVVSENPVYVQGDWNSANGGASDFNGANAATAVIADAVTLLSNNWNDAVSFANPDNPGARNRINPTWYRLAIIGGKGPAFPQPAGTPTDFGTDGGAHNFLRFLENGDAAVNYLGATATFFFNRQAVGTYKCCTTVYGAPARNYNFDINFNNPALLPPNTPVFRDMNSVGFSQELRPGR